MWVNCLIAEDKVDFIHIIIICVKILRLFNILSAVNEKPSVGSWRWWPVSGSSVHV